MSESPRLAIALLARLRGLSPLLVLVVVAWLGWREMKEIDLVAVRGLLRETGGDLILAMIAITSLNLALFGFYDVVALGPLSRGPSLGARWMVGMVSFAWSNFLTVGPLAGPALRLWLYRPLGVDGPRARAALTGT